MGACKDLAAQNDTAAYAGSQRDHDNIGMALAAAVPLLAECRDVCVIADFHRHAAQKRRELPLDIKNAPAEIDALVDDTVSKNRTGNADTDAFEIIEREILLIELLGDRARDIRKDHLAVAFLARGNLPVIKKLSFCSEKTDLYGCPADVNTKCIWLHSFCIPPNPLIILVQRRRSHPARTVNCITYLYKLIVT